MTPKERRNDALTTLAIATTVFGLLGILGYVAWNKIAAEERSLAIAENRLVLLEQHVRVVQAKWLACSCGCGAEVEVPEDTVMPPGVPLSDPE